MSKKEYQILPGECDEEPSYRYRLVVSTMIESSNELSIIQLNPSTGSATQSDPTIGKVSCWAKQNEFGRVTFLNLFAVRTAYPHELIGKSYEALVGPRNDDIMRSAFSGKGTIVFAWGKLNAAIASHSEQRLSFLKQALGDRRVYAVGKPVAGMFPRHGRMWNGANRKLRPYPMQ